MTIEISLTFKVHDLDQIVQEGPTMPMRHGDGEIIHEPLVLVGDVHAPMEAREQLECYAICLTLATYDQQERCWNRCLFSEEAANTLVELDGEGQFPFALEAAPSAAHIATLEAVASGAEAPALALGQWVRPASIEALARAVKQGLIQSPWLRRTIGTKSS